MPLETTPYDTAELLDTPERIAAYIDAVLEDGDPALVQDAIGTVARARGMTQIARETGLTRESLYKALASTGNPSFNTITRVLKSLGMRLAVEPVT